MKTDPPPPYEENAREHQSLSGTSNTIAPAIITFRNNRRIAPPKYQRIEISFVKQDRLEAFYCLATNEYYLERKRRSRQAVADSPAGSEIITFSKVKFRNLKTYIPAPRSFDVDSNKFPEWDWEVRQELASFPCHYTGCKVHGGLKCYCIELHWYGTTFSADWKPFWELKYEEMKEGELCGFHARSNTCYCLTPPPAKSYLGLYDLKHGRRLKSAFQL